MSRSSLLVLPLVVLAACTSQTGSQANAQVPEISGERIRAHVKFLSSDLMEGRAPGSRGGKLATEYIASQFAVDGAKPFGDDGTYFQNFQLVGVQPIARDTKLTVIPNGNPPYGLKWLDDFVGVTQRQISDAMFNAEAVFVGHGIVAPEYNWNDYAGVDVKDKVVVMFTSDPASEDPDFFGGRALTYYGRWTYKFEEAARQGAMAAIIIHTNETASYGWDVVRSSWGTEEQQVALEPGQPALMFAGWVTQDIGDQIGSTIGMSAEQMLAEADSKDFKARVLPLSFRGNVPAVIRTVDTRNVVARIPGSDPALADQAVVFSAHWDHLGIGEEVNGDAIYNGAADNATGIAMILEMARAWENLPEKPRRSAIFLAAAAEEQGLRGSYYFGQNPPIPASRIAAGLNFDMFMPFGQASNVTVNGAERTTIYDIVQNAAQRMNMSISPDPRPEAGSYYRSDHFSFARVGIPSFSIDNGDELLGKPGGEGLRIIEEFNSTKYHQPSDEYDESWDFAGMVQYAEFGMLIGIDVANQEAMPTWQPGDEFLAAREESGVK